VDPIEKNEYPILGKAPIVLAILQIQYRLKQDVSNASFAKIHSLIKEKYPILNESSSAQLQVNPKDVNTPVSLKYLRSDGYNFSTKDGIKSFSISNTAFTYQMGSPYNSWAEFSKEALEVWKICGLEQKIEIVLRHSIRYVNAFEIKEETGIVEPSDYFNSFLVVDQKYPNYNRYMFQYTVPLEPSGIISHIGMEIRESFTNVFPFVFDIDVIDMKNVEYDPIKLKSSFDKLREYKNSIFFNTLKERTIQIFK
jgi:uncharacterized protein (TIGR04255 family)